MINSVLHLLDCDKDTFHIRMKIHAAVIMDPDRIRIFMKLKKVINILRRQKSAHDLHKVIRYHTRGGISIFDHFEICGRKIEIGQVIAIFRVVSIDHQMVGANILLNLVRICPAMLVHHCDNGSLIES